MRGTVSETIDNQVGPHRSESTKDNSLDVLDGGPLDRIHVQHVLDQRDHALVQVVGYLEDAGFDLSKQRRYVLLVERQRAAE